MEIERTKQIQALISKVEALGHSNAETIKRFDFEALRTTLANFASVSSDLLTEQKILGSLRFKQMRVRQSAIPEAHAKTFRWIFKSHEGFSDPKPHVKFVEWLQQPSVTRGMYWIGGKPGSGKSTLMKFICDHPHTKAALQAWACPNRLVTASFFFWHSGTVKQKSQEGLLQTLLYEILRKCPDAISGALLHRWKSMEQGAWDRDELLETLRALRGKLKSSVYFCFFVDGLDEYGVNPQEVLDVLRDISAEENVKLCVSSRPWPIFQKEFDGDPNRRLDLQDLTRDDIARYVRNKLEETPDFIKSSNEDKRYKDLVVEIVEKAQGVFLWVFLVVRSLLEGLTNEDTIRTLQKRLRALPSDLWEFFKHMLDSVEDIYQTQVARTFQISLVAAEPVYTLAYSFIDDLEDDPNFTLKMKIQLWHSKFTKTSKMKNSDIAAREAQMQKRITARSKGLLEVQGDQESPFGPLVLQRVDFCTEP